MWFNVSIDAIPEKTLHEKMLNGWPKKLIFAK